MKKRAKKLFIDAINNVNEANNELSRPEEDVVSILVCKKAQLATKSFLEGYLLKNDIEPQKDATLQDLYNECFAINPRFKKVDLSNFDCRSVTMKNRDCTDVKKVNGCYMTAFNLDAFLREEKVI